MRLRYISNRNKRYRLLKKWRPEITGMLLTGETKMSVLPAQETLIFLEEWNRMFGTIRGQNLRALIKLAQHLQVDRFSRKMLKSRRMRDRLFAIITLGHMREYSAWDEIAQLLHHPHSILSLTAARALMWINPKDAIEIIIPLITTRSDWPWANVAHVLKQAPPLQLCERLSQEVLTVPVERQAGLLRYMEASRCLQAPKFITTILSTTNDDHVLSVCLHIIADPDSLQIIRQFVTHSRWHIRMHAAVALGRLGENDDIPMLLEMTADNNWWVRYRAAQALALIPGQNADSLMLLREQQKDGFARDILNHVIAEVQAS